MEGGVHSQNGNGMFEQLLYKYLDKKQQIFQTQSALTYVPKRLSSFYK